MYYTNRGRNELFFIITRAVDPYSLYTDPDPDPAVFLNADPDPNPDPDLDPDPGPGLA